MAVMPAQRIYEGTRIPSPCPTILRVDPAEQVFPMIPAGAAALDMLEYDDDAPNVEARAL